MAASEILNKEALQKQLVADLSRERVLSRQVLSYIADQYSYSEDQFAQFVSEKAPTLEPYEFDLIFSPLFTPVLADREPYGALLQGSALSQGEIETLIAQLCERSVYGHFLTPTGENVPMVLHEVMIERFVERLSLDKPIEPTLYALIRDGLPTAEQALVNMLARDAVWKDEWRKETLAAFLKLYQQQQEKAPAAKVQHLTDFLRTYRPARFEDLNRQLDSLIQSCEQDLEHVRGRRFHDPQLKEIYEADNYKGVSVHEEDDQQVIANYQQMIVKAQALRKDLETLKIRMPEAVTAIQSREGQVV